MKDKKLRIARRKKAQEAREIELFDQSNPENWGKANAYVMRALRKHPFEIWLKQSDKDKAAGKSAWFTHDHVYAAGRIATGFLAEYDATMAKISKLEKVDGSRIKNYTDHQVDCIKEYCYWVDAMTKHKMSYRPVIDMAVFEWRPTIMDTHYKKRKGWAKITVVKGLDIFLGVQQVRRAA